MALAVAFALIGGAQALVWGFFVSTVLLWHGSFAINSLAHLFGSRRYATGDNSRNNWLLAIATTGEGWHNNHHHYQSSANQGFFWWEIDVTYYLLRLLQLIGLVWDLRRPPPDVVRARASPPGGILRGAPGVQSREHSPREESAMQAMNTSTVLMATLLAAGAAAAEKPAAPFDTAAIEALTGAKGAYDAKEGVFKVSLPRGDINATAAGVRMTPPLGLTAWAAFTKAGKHTMVMGDIVLLEDQVNPVMSAALDNGLEVTALHNHFFWDSPKVMFMHVGGMGDDKVLAGAVGKVFARLKETAGGKGEVLRADIDPAKTTLSPAKIERCWRTRASSRTASTRW